MQMTTPHPTRSAVNLNVTLVSARLVTTGALTELELVYAEAGDGTKRHTVRVPAEVRGPHA
jgi:hypothetical protein